MLYCKETSLCRGSCQRTCSSSRNTIWHSLQNINSVAPYSFHKGQFHQDELKNGEEKPETARTSNTLRAHIHTHTHTRTYTHTHAPYICISDFCCTVSITVITVNIIILIIILIIMDDSYSQQVFLQNKNSTGQHTSLIHIH